jgi:hypothetical protein
MIVFVSFIHVDLFIQEQCGIGDGTQVMICRGQGQEEQTIDRRQDTGTTNIRDETRDRGQEETPTGRQTGDN